jgi:hypothetical protein
MGRRLPLSEAAIRLGRDYQQVRRLVLRGTLAGGRDEFGRLYVDEESVDRFIRRQEAVEEASLSAGR